jgi:hypothetical protein
MPIQEAAKPAEIIVSFCPGGQPASPAPCSPMRCTLIARRCSTPDNIRIGGNVGQGSDLPGATDAQMEEHRADLRAWGQGSTHIRLLPNRKNMLKIELQPVVMKMRA